MLPQAFIQIFTMTFVVKVMINTFKYVGIVHKCKLVPPAGIEPAPRAPEALVISI